MGRLVIVGLVLLGCSASSGESADPIVGKSHNSESGSNSGGSSSQLEAGSGGSETTPPGGSSSAGSSGASTLPVAGSGGAPTATAGTTSGGSSAGQASAGTGGSEQGGQATAGTGGNAQAGMSGGGGKPPTCDVQPYLKANPRTVTAGPIWQTGHEYTFGETVTVRAPDLTKIQHFVCATVPTCKYEPSIHTSDWKWTEAGVWMCEIKPGWSDCAA